MKTKPRGGEVLGLVVAMETGNNPNSSSATAMSNPGWPTIDGPLGLSEEESVAYARRFFRFGFCLLPWLWALNCFYFWPVLLRSRSFPRLRPCNSLSFSAFCLFFFIFSRPISRISGFWQLSSLESLPLHASFLYKLSRFLFVFFCFSYILYKTLWVLSFDKWVLLNPHCCIWVRRNIWVIAPFDFWLSWNFIFYVLGVG